MIELYEFSLLPLNDRAETLWAHGELITNFKENGNSYNLYSFFGYFVEVKLSNPANQIIDIRPFRKGEILNKYLDFIDINKLA